MKVRELVPWRVRAARAARVAGGGAYAGFPVRLIVVLLVAAGLKASGQVALQNAVITDRAIDARRQASEEALKDLPGGEVGPVQYSVGFSYSVSFSDNVNFSENDAQTDLIQTPTVELGVAVPITQRSSLGFKVGIGYQSYWHNEELSRWLITPDSELAYDLQIKDALITVFNRFSYSQDVYNEPGLAGRATFPRFENTAGTQVTWIPNDYVVAGGYSYELVVSGSDQVSYINRGSHLVFGRLGHLYAEGAINTGAEISATFTAYEQSTNDTTTALSLGPYFEWKVSDSLNASVRGGYVSYSYTTVGAPMQSTDQSSFYAGLAANHQLTDYISHTLSVTHGIFAGVEQGTAFVIQTDVGYSVAYDFAQSAALRAGVNYVNGEQEESVGAASERFDQFRFDAGLSWAVTEKLALTLLYDLVVRDSSEPDRSYTRNQVTLGGGYTF